MISSGQDEIRDTPLQFEAELISVAGGPEMLERIDPDGFNVLMFDLSIPPEEISSILHRIDGRVPTTSTVAIVTGPAASADLLRPFVETGQILYMSRAPLPYIEMAALIRAVIRDATRLHQDRARRVAAIAASDSLLAFHGQLLRQRELGTVTRLLEEAARELLQADESRYFAYDSRGNELFSVRGFPEEEWRYSAAYGLTGYAVRTRQPVVVQRASSDPRFYPGADLPDNGGDARFLAQPITGVGVEPIVGVLTVYRDKESQPFSAEEVRVSGDLAAIASPMLATLTLHSDIMRALRQNQAVEMFREEALEHQTREWEMAGSLPSLNPSWLQRAHWALLGFAFIGMTYIALARVNESAVGPAFIRAATKYNVVAMVDRMVRSVDVSVGDSVRAGSRLLTFFELPHTNSPLSTDGRDVWAPADGIVTELSARPGQSVRSGDHLASIVDEREGFEALALFPALYAPLLRPGMPVAIAIDGHRGSHAAGVIEHVGEISNSQDVTRQVKLFASDSTSGSNSVVTVRVRMLRPVFDADDQRLPFRDGMRGRGRVIVRTESVLLALVPSLKKLWEP